MTTPKLSFQKNAWHYERYPFSIFAQYLSCTSMKNILRQKFATLRNRDYMSQLFPMNSAKFLGITFSYNSFWRSFLY